MFVYGRAIGRITRLARPSVRPSVCPYEATSSELENQRAWTFSQHMGIWCANFWFKKSKVEVIECQKLHENQSINQSICKFVKRPLNKVRMLCIITASLYGP